MLFRSITSPEKAKRKYKNGAFYDKSDLGRNRISVSYCLASAPNILYFCHTILGVLDDLCCVIRPFAPVLSAMPGRFPEKVSCRPSEFSHYAGSSRTLVLLDRKSLALSAMSGKAQTAPDGQHETFFQNKKRDSNKVSYCSSFVAGTKSHVLSGISTKSHMS